MAYLSQVSLKWQAFLHLSCYVSNQKLQTKKVCLETKPFFTCPPLSSEVEGRNFRERKYEAGHFVSAELMQPVKCERL